MAASKIRIKLKAYDHAVLDQSAEKIVEIAKRTGAKISGPIPLPTDKEVITILRAVHKYKDSREQFERRTHKRLIDILVPGEKTMESLVKIDLPAGVEIDVVLQSEEKSLCVLRSHDDPVAYFRLGHTGKHSREIYHKFTV